MRRRNPTKPTHPVAASDTRGAGYVAFDGAAPADPLQAAIGAPYAHATAPLRRLVDRWSLVVCEALASDRPVPDWARRSLPDVPRLMARGDGVAGRLDAGTLARVTAALMARREGHVFSAVVLGRHDGGMRAQLAQPPVAVKVAGLDAAPGATVRLRLDRVDIATGEVDLVPAS